MIWCFDADHLEAALAAYLARLATTVDGVTPAAVQAIREEVLAFLQSPEARAHKLVVPARPDVAGR